MPNPYEPPPSRTGPSQDNRAPNWWTSKRCVAGILFAMPFLLLNPVHHWAHNRSIAWNAYPDELGFLYVILMYCIFAVAIFIAFVLLWLDDLEPSITGAFAIVSGVMAIPALPIAWILVL